MKTALKYGLLITFVVVLWVVITHFVFPLAPQSKLNNLAPLLFNLAAIVAIYLGIRERQRAREMSFKEGLTAGMSITLVYALSSCLFFFVLFLLVGPKLMANEAMAQTELPLWQLALIAFAGMFVGSLILGLVYSTVVSFLLAKRNRAV